MRKILFFLLPIMVVGGILVWYTTFFKKGNEKGALQVTSIPKSAVYLNGKQIGQTPLCKCDPGTMLPVGEYTVKLVPLESTSLPFEEKVTIGKSVLTVVDRTFGEGPTAEGSIITLTPLKTTKDVELLILSLPDKAEVLLDNVIAGSTPLLLNNISASDHEIKILKSGYKEKIVRIRVVPGYKLTGMIYLGINPSLEAQSATKNSSVEKEASESATPFLVQVSILSTPTGFLRVSAVSSLDASEIAQVTPGESFELLEEKTEWFRIKLQDGSSGWISSAYAQKE